MTPAAKLLMRSAGLLVLAAGAAGTLNLCRPDRLPWRGNWAQHVENRARQAGLALVGPATVRQAVATGTPRLLDARPAVDFRAGHIPRAVALPAELAEEMLTTLQVQLARDQPLITYCARTDCDEGLVLALFLRHSGYTNVTLFAGGLAEWRAAGGAVEAGP